MHIKFKRVNLKNFMSFQDAEIELSDRGYILVSGKNNSLKDNAKSNGSGKSSIWNAISWALTGETLSGISTGVSNIVLNEGCFVELEFDIDNTSYIITRYREYQKIGNDLKIIINGEDKSGKGIRESQKLLEEYLPDITKDLIGSVIILGQGLPQKFSNNTPAGRKEILEKLSKSDYMIEDIKARLVRRQNDLNKFIRSKEDQLLVVNTSISTNSKAVDEDMVKLNNLVTNSNFDEQINHMSEEIKSKNVDITNVSEMCDTLSKQIESRNAEYNEVFKTEQSELSAHQLKYTQQLADLTNGINEQSVLINNLNREIMKLESIQDTCPTCGQKIPNVHKPDTSNLKKELDVHQNKLKSLNDQKIKISGEEISGRINIQEKYKQELNDYQNVLNNLKSELNKHHAREAQLNKELLNLNVQLAQISANRESFLKSKNDLEVGIANRNLEIARLKEQSLYIINDKEELSKHLAVVDKMNTVVKRDFRGFLLTNVIDFINRKAKEYCLEVFETTDIDFKLEGNNINISYLGKPYENLSGGEKQKLDLIIQFSIRDMLCQHLNFSCNMLAMDEVFDGLDTIGCQKVLDLISKKLSDVESIFIITHHDFDLAIPSDGEIIVEKDNRGISRIK